MSGRIVLSEAMVVTATAGPAFAGSVVVEDGRVADVLEGPGRPPASSGEARVVRLGGRSLLPGLIDAHVHATAVDADIGSQPRRRYESEIAVLAGVALKEMLMRGFTTVRDAGGADAGFRRAIETGAVPGPRLLVSGRPLGQTGGHGDQRSPTETADGGDCEPHVGLVHVIADGPEAVRRSAREELRRGANQVKVMAGSIEHGNLLDEATAKLMADHGTYLVPTLVTYEKLHDEGSRHGIPGESLDKLTRVIDAGLDSLHFAARAGVKIASGSDLLGPMRCYQGEEIAIKAGALGAMAAIVAATRTNAELLGLEAEIGTIEVGKKADLIVADGDVLDDPAVLGRPAGVVLVMLGGNVVHEELS